MSAGDDRRAAGRLGDARRVQAQLRARYDGPGKAIVRHHAVRRLQAEGIETVLDFWGGGVSADALVRAGMRVVSVENGSSPTDGITRRRLRQAIQTLAPTVSYDLRAGPAEAAVAECDGAFLDFCGHYTSSMGRLLRACRHMRAIAVTVMPERTMIGSGMTPREWHVATLALLTDASGMNVRSVKRYSRKSQLPALLFVLSSRAAFKTFAAYENAIWRDNGRHAARQASPGYREHKAALQKARRESWTPDEQERQRELRRAYVRRQRATPEGRRKQRAKAAGA